MSAPQPQSKVPQGPSAPPLRNVRLLVGQPVSANCAVSNNKGTAYFAGGMPWRGQCCRWGRLLAALDGAFQCSGEGRNDQLPLLLI